MSANGLTVARKLKDLDPSTQAHLVSNEGFDPRWGFIENDRPRDYEHTADILAATVGFALIDEARQIVGTFKSLEEAEHARAGARVVFTTEIDLEPTKKATGKVAQESQA